MLSPIFYFISRVTGFIVAVWPVLLIFGINSSDFMQFVHGMVILLVTCLITTFVSLILALVL